MAYQITVNKRQGRLLRYEWRLEREEGGFFTTVGTGRSLFRRSAKKSALRAMKREKRRSVK
ncbi:hypothetical protein [Bifidobacterium moukalabense]|uniref:hypothetical protein n=1 Tax=Bifidobacterium moukalabense TaxID=1333651 RepID=UPI0010FA4D16|nr:hypothetical protein [Bifidobacterium moukalabense]